MQINNHVGGRSIMIRFGVIGTNWITERFLAAASELEDFSLEAVYSRKEETALAFATKHGAAHTYTSVEELANSPYVDAIYIASPNSFHAEHAITCMNGGKHVICEKPLASNTQELEAMLKASKENNVFLMEAMKSAFLPNFKAIQANIGKIGKVRRYFASYCQYSSRYDAYKKGEVLNAFNPTFSNGALMDIGVYCIYPLIVLFGEPKSLKANAIMLESGVDGEGSVLFQYDEMDAIVMYSKISNSYVPSEIQGENGSIVIDNINTPRKVEIYYKDGSVEDISEDQHQNAMFYEVKEFIEYLKQDNKELNLTDNHARTVARVSEEIRKQIGLIFPADE
jgi:scyllo-inositol 2-dehydrogenase (NADP+)